MFQFAQKVSQRTLVAIFMATGSASAAMAQNASTLPAPIQNKISQQCAQGGYSAYIVLPEKGGAQEVFCENMHVPKNFFRDCKGMHEEEKLLADAIHDIRRQLAETKDESIGFWNIDVDREEAEKDILPKMEADLKHVEQALTEMHKDPEKYSCPVVS